MRFRRRFAEVIRRQLDSFAEDDADYLKRVADAENTYDLSDKEDSEELYGDYMELVEAGTEVLAEMRDLYSGTLGEDDAEEYASEFNRAVLKRWPAFALEIEDV